MKPLLTGRIKHTAIAFLFVASATAWAAPSFAADEADARRWASWRGPNDAGSTTQGKYVADFSPSKNVLWKVKLPGKGCSTPIVWGRRIIITSPVDGHDAAICYDWSGKQQWLTKVGKERAGRHRNGSGSNPSAITDGHQVFVYFKSGNLAALDLDGKLKWKTNLQERYAKDSLYWDLGTSPVLTRDHVIIAVMHSSGSYVVAFNKSDGEVAWNVDRNYKTPTEGDHSYATPHVIEREGKQRILIWGAEHVTAHDAATGNVLWYAGNFNPKGKRNWVVVASSALVGDVLVVPYGRGAHLAGVKLGGRGDVTESHRLWTRDGGAFVPTPAVHKGVVYVLGDRGDVQRIDPKTGKTVWSGQFPKKSAKYYASPTVADGKLYAAREDGKLFVASIEGDFKVLAEIDMNERLIASPVPVANRLLIRGEKHLYCFGEK